MTNPNQTRSTRTILAAALALCALTQTTPTALAYTTTTASARTTATATTNLPIFELRIDPLVHPDPYTGRVYVVLSTSNDARPPRLRMNDWFSPPTILALDVQNIQPNQPIRIDPADAAVLRYDGEGVLSQWATGKLRQAATNPTKNSNNNEPTPVKAQAIARVNKDSCKPGMAEGDLASAVISLNPADNAKIAFTLVHAVPPQTFTESENIKLVEIVSPSLSAFHNREVRVRAAVSLPENYHQSPSNPRPVVVMIGGFGGDANDINWAQPLLRNASQRPIAKETIIVVPDATNFHGHSVFANSDVTGPWATALCDELLTEIDNRYNTAGPEHRYVTGISSGGWASLWLLTDRPDAFRACFSHVPDPVDFHDFQQIDLYAQKANMYRDETGAQRPIARRGTTPILYYQDFVAREDTLGPGGQIHSFEAVFGPPDQNGNATPMFNRTTGDVYPNVIEHWKRYDIREVIEQNWHTHHAEWKGNFYVWAGEIDNFFLEGAVERLAKTFEKLEANATAKVIEALPHTFYIPGFETMFERIEQDWNARQAESTE